MKTRVVRYHLVKTLNYYEEKLAEKFGSRALNEVMKELIRREAPLIQMRMARQEKTNSWLIPIKVHFEDNGVYRVVPECEADILIID